ncbi:MAG: MFS transporter [Cyanobacteriota bacterium]|nr:MFS transporter [Cyanobacteriota bacterium]
MNLKRQTIVAFVSPAIPLAALGLPMVVYLPPFYAEEMGLGLSLVGTIFMITRFWDVFTDPVLGIISDKVTTPLGRRRHWIILSVPILMICVFKIFVPQPPVSGTYLLVWMILLYIGWTLLSISHMSWGAELSSDYYERSRVQGWREFALIFGMLAVLVLPAVIEHLSDASDQMRVAAMGWFVIVFLPITVAIAVSQVSERPTPNPPPMCWKRATVLLLKNRLLLRVLLADLCTGIAPGITGALYIFFVNSVMDLGKWSSLMLLLYFVASFCGIPFWIRLSYRLEKHQTFTAAKIYISVTLLSILFVEPGNIWLYALCNILFGLASGAGAFLLRSIMADVTDHDYLESGTQRTGLYYSLLTMTNKIGYAVAVGITYPILDGIGFVPGGVNTPETLTALKYIFVFTPIPILLLAALVMWNFPLDSEQQERLRRLIYERDEMLGTDPNSMEGVSE